MNSESWQKYKLQELVQINEISISNTFEHDEIEYIDTSSVTQNTFTAPQVLKLKDAPGRAKRIVRDGDTIISTVRPIQKHFGIIKNAKPNTIVSTGFAVLTPRKIDPDFLYYYLSQNTVTHYLNGIAETSTTTFPAFRPETLLELELMIPTSGIEQTKIASILSSLDDKIELNRQTNKTLEEIAQTLFKEMCLLKGDVLPEGWDIKPLHVLGKIVCGKTPPKLKSEHFNGDIPFIKIPDMHGNPYIVNTSDSLTPSGVNSQSNKTIPANSIIVSCIATVGLVSLTSKVSQTNQQINSIIPYDNNFLYFLYFSMKSVEGLLAELGSGGSATLNVNTSTFSNIALRIPPIEVLQYYHEKVLPLFSLILINQYEIQSLITLRDTLLPKLMKGEVEI